MRRRPAQPAIRVDRADRLVGQVGPVPQAALQPRAVTTTPTIDRIKTPIGLADITGKEPATIAVSVAADLLRTFETEGD